MNELDIAREFLKSNGFIPSQGTLIELILITLDDKLLNNEETEGYVKSNDNNADSSAIITTIDNKFHRLYFFGGNKEINEQDNYYKGYDNYKKQDLRNNKLNDIL